ncbi:MAG: hypothetical protein Q8O19_06445 [Rectinemataceae bacterium]|nr:hypothetical protein [Rectinemataceae bacterium]
MSSEDKKYRPSNGTEGDYFYENWCFRCKRDQGFRDGLSNDGCRILADTMAYLADDPNYPKEWVYGEDGDPICTAFDEDTKDCEVK